MTMKSKDFPARPRRFRDADYIKSFQDDSCMACGITDNKVIGAHVSPDYTGKGPKPDDDLTLPLCRDCRISQRRMGDAEFWLSCLGGTDLIDLLQHYARTRYAAWKTKGGKQ